MTLSVLYSGKIRQGQAGTLTDENYKVIFDDETNYAYLDPLPVIDYSNETYRELVNNNASVEEYFKLHDKEQTGYFNYIAKYLKRGDIVADCGCGAGSMLDLVGGFADTTVAIEPFLGYHQSLKQRGHQPFTSIKDAISKFRGSVDLALSIHVIEHTDDPLAYLTDIYNLLTENGKAIIFTPNLDDILLKIHPEAYQPFFFRKVHNFYFTGKSLEIMGKKVGFKNANRFYYQEFGIGNIFEWLRENKPKGNIGFECLDNYINSQWIKFLEESGQSYNVGVVLEK